MHGRASALRVALVQAVPHYGNVEQNILDASALVSGFRPGGNDFVLFPELSLTGYDLSLMKRGSSWITPGDPRLRPLQESSESSGAVVVVGAAVVDREGHPRLASVVFSPSGSCHVIPKTYLHGEEKDYFTPGATGAPGSITVKGWKVGLGVCFDAAVPDHAAAVARAGADIYAVSGLYTTGQERRLDIHLASRAMDHGMYTLLANLGGAGPGWESCGGTGSWGPDGSIRQKTNLTTEAVVFDEIEVVHRSPVGS